MIARFTPEWSKYCLWNNVLYLAVNKRVSKQIINILNSLKFLNNVSLSLYKIFWQNFVLVPVDGNIVFDNVCTKIIKNLTYWFIDIWNSYYIQYFDYLILAKINIGWTRVVKIKWMITVFSKILKVKLQDTFYSVSSLIFASPFSKTTIIIYNLCQWVDHHF